MSPGTQSKWDIFERGRDQLFQTALRFRYVPRPLAHHRNVPWHTRNVPDTRTPSRYILLATDRRPSDGQVQTARTSTEKSWLLVGGRFSQLQVVQDSLPLRPDTPDL